MIFDQKFEITVREWLKNPLYASGVFVARLRRKAHQKAFYQCKNVYFQLVEEGTRAMYVCKFSSNLWAIVVLPSKKVHQIKPHKKLRVIFLSPATSDIIISSLRNSNHLPPNY